MTVFNPLNVPTSWNQYYTKYPEGYTILESLLNWVQQVNDMVTNQNELNTTWEEWAATNNKTISDFIAQFDTDLQEKVTDTLSQWQSDGTLDVIISAALQTQIDTVQDSVESQYINVKFPPAGLTPLKGDGTDETTAFVALINYASQHTPATLFFPNGTYSFTDLGQNIAFTNITYEGATDRGVVWKCLNTAPSHNAVNFDKFYNGDVVGFAQKCNVKNIIFEGNSETEIIVNMQGLARCNWENVYARGAKASATSKGFAMKGINLSLFTNLMVSNQLDSGFPMPYNGLYLDEGFRAGASVGHTSNCTFNTCYVEGASVGFNLYKADQCIFIGGSPESCTDRGVLISTSYYNTFIGVGFENANSILDVEDYGFFTQYINCYSVKDVKLRGQGQRISGGRYNDIEVMTTALQCVIENVTIKHNGGTIGLNDSGVGTKWRGIYDETTAGFIYPALARTGITVGASPFTWTNNTGNLVQLFIAGGAITNLQSIRKGGDPYAISTSIPQVLTVAPNDGVTVTYTTTPGMSFRVLNGF